jgi:hypothetical protein
MNSGIQLHEYAQIQEALLHLEKIETVKLAARGLPNEATSVSKARVLLDRIIKNIAAEKQSGS